MTNYRLIIFHAIPSQSLVKLAKANDQSFFSQFDQASNVFSVLHAVSCARQTKLKCWGRTGQEAALKDHYGVNLSNLLVARYV